MMDKVATLISVDRIYHLLRFIYGLIHHATTVGKWG